MRVQTDPETDAEAPTARQGGLASWGLSIGSKQGFMCVRANAFFYFIKLLTETAGMISVHAGKISPKVLDRLNTVMIIDNKL